MFPPSVSRQATLTAIHFEVLRRLGFANGDPRSNGELAAAQRILHAATGQRPVVFDVGANAGEYTQMLLAEVGREVEVHAFEPSPAAFTELAQHLDGTPHVTLHRLGLGSEEAEAMLRSAAPGSATASFYRRDAVAQPITESVSVRRLDSICAELRITKIDLLKVDAEGHDLEVLRGGGELLDGRRVGAIQFEHGGTAPDARVFLRDFFDLLGERYLIHRVLPDGLWPLDRYTEQIELTLFANYVALPRAVQTADAT